MDRPAPARLVLLATLTALAIGSAPLAPAHGSACSFNMSIRLADFPVPGLQPPLYYVVEEATTARFAIVADGPGCPEDSGQADYDTPPGSAESEPIVGDYQRVVGTTPPFNNANRRHEVEIPINEDVTVDDQAAESVNVGITDVRLNATFGVPSSAPLFILDDEGTTRLAWPATSRTLPEAYNRFDDSLVKIPVLRAGASATGPVTFSISPETNDLSRTSGDVEFLPGGRLGTINLRITDDDLDEDELEQFTIRLEGAPVDGPSTFTLRIDDDDVPGGGDEDVLAPDAFFHHPKQGGVYKQGSFQSDTIHLFATERPVHDDRRIHSGRIALRRRMTNGSCSWWAGSSWQSGGCASVRWLVPSEYIPNYSPSRVLFIYDRYASLKPSIGTRIKNYTVFGRATDIAENVSRLVGGESQNTFEVKRR